MLPTIKLGQTDITRLIIGGNTISGTSHVSPEMDLAMQEYFTMQRIQDMFFSGQDNGINTLQLRIDAHIVRALMEFRLNGGKMHWIAQTAPEYGSLENNLRMASKIGPVAVYYHGSVVDNFYKDGEIDNIKKGLKTLRMLGVPVGMCTHMPEVLLRAEEEEWGADFYMACVYNLMKIEHISSSIIGKFNNGECFDEEDRAVMLDAILRVQKPVLAFKILGSTRRCETTEDLESAFTEAYTSIKNTDACIVGMYPKESDQVSENARIVAKLLGK